MPKVNPRLAALGILWGARKEPEDLDEAVFRLFSEKEADPEAFAAWRKRALAEAAAAGPDVAHEMGWIFGNRNTAAQS
jgi:hypothetical protein